MNNRALASTQAQTSVPAASPRGGILQRKCACGNHTMGGAECAECSAKKKKLQRKSGGADVAAEDAPSVVYDALRSPGQPLDPATRRFMETRLGYDFRDVRVHTDAAAVESARAVGALAYTAGRDVVFGGGQYSPKSDAGRQLIAHELAHVLQQSSSRMEQGRLQIGDPGDPLERQADQMAMRAVGPIAGPVHAGRAPYARSDAGILVQAKPARPSAAAKPASRGTPIVEDGQATAAGQMHRSDFLRSLREALIRECDIEFAAVGRSAAKCPYILRSIERYASAPLSALVRVISLFAHPPAGADAHGLIRAVTQRARAVARNIVKKDNQTKKDNKKIQRTAEPGEAALPAHDAATIRSQLGSGRPLDVPLRRRMERSFGTDFTGVRVHDDAVAARFSSALGARAFAVGDDIAFGAGEYRPGTAAGDLIVAHELTHTIQQDRRASAGPGLTEDRALEHEAERAARDATAGRRVTAAPESAGLRVQRLPVVVAGALVVAEATPEIIVASEIGADVVLVDGAVVAADVAAPAVVDVVAPAAVDVLAPAAVDATAATTAATTSSTLSTVAGVTAVGAAATLSSDSPEEEEQDPRRKCFEYNPGAIPCEEGKSGGDEERDQIISDFLQRPGASYNCKQFGVPIPAGNIDDCGLAPAIRYHCKLSKDTTVTIFACLCCDLEGNSRLQWSRPHISSGT